MVIEDSCRPDKVAEQIALEEDNPKMVEKTIRQYAEFFAKPNTDVDLR